MISNIEELTQNEAIAYFRADLCLSDPENYTLDEKRKVCEQMESTSRAIEDAIKADFETLPPAAQDKMLDLLEKADPEHFDWWMETLVGSMPDHAEGLMR